MKDRFSSDEWDLLTRLPMVVYGSVASADGIIDDTEVAQLAQDVATWDHLKDEMHREIAAELLDLDSDAVFEMALNVTPGQLEEMKAILRDKLTPDEYQGFMASLFIHGIRIARASGSGRLGLGDPICQDERDALATFVEVFELDMDSVSKQFG